MREHDVTFSATDRASEPAENLELAVAL